MSVECQEALSRWRVHTCTMYNTGLSSTRTVELELRVGSLCCECILVRCTYSSGYCVLCTSYYVRVQGTIAVLVRCTMYLCTMYIVHTYAPVCTSYIVPCTCMRCIDPWYKYGVITPQYKYICTRYTICSTHSILYVYMYTK